MPTIARSRTALLAFTGVSFVGILAGCSSTTGNTAGSTSGDGSSSSAASAPATADPAQSTPATSSSDDSGNDAYKDGSYTEQGTYSSPGGQELISVTMTIDSDKVKDVAVKTVKADPTATQYEAMFISGIKAAVVGKKIDDLKVTKVAGSSLTSQGFDNALTKIKTDAKS